MSPDSKHKATRKEIEWCDEMRALMARKPKSLTLFCNGWMHVLSTDEVNAQCNVGGLAGCMPQPIQGIDALGKADGGDF